MLIKASDRDEFKKFTRTLTGLVARLVTGARKGKPVGKFWDGLFFSRLVSWGRDFFNVRYYVIQNLLETDGVIDFKKQSHFSNRSRP